MILIYTLLKLTVSPPLASSSVRFKEKDVDGDFLFDEKNNDDDFLSLKPVFIFIIQR